MAPLPATKSIRMWNRAGADYVDVLYVLNEDGKTYSMSTVTASGGEGAGLTNEQLRNSAVPVSLATLPVGVSSNNIGIKSFEFSRPANTTGYTKNDAVNVDLATSGATQATPIVVTTTGNHSLADGDVVTISGITGNTNANGTFYAKVATYTGTTFALYSDKALTTPVVGNGAYGGTGHIARLWRLKDIFRVDGGSGYILKIRMLTDLKTSVESYRLHFYGSPIAAQLDNIAFTLLWANRAIREGYIDMPIMSTEDSAGSDSAHSQQSKDFGLFEVHNAEAIPTKDLYVRIEIITAVPAGTNTASQNFFVEVTVANN